MRASFLEVFSPGNRKASISVGSTKRSTRTVSGKNIGEDNGKRRSLSQFLTDKVGQPRSSFMVSFSGPSGGGPGRSTSISSSAYSEKDMLPEIDAQAAADEASSKSFRVQMKTFLAYSAAGQVYETFLLLCSILSAVLYICQLYFPSEDTGIEMIMRMDVMFLIEIALCIIFSADFLLWFMLSEQKSDYLTSTPTIIDLVFIVPTWIMMTSTPNNRTPIALLPDYWAVFVWLLFACKTARVLRALRLRSRVMDMFENEVQQSIGGMTVFISIMIVFNAALLEYVEAADQPLPFHSWLYCIWITTATVGYGDISPVTLLGRFAVMLMIGVSIITVPKMTNELLETMASSSVFARAKYSPRPEHKHILICGDLRSTSIPEFFAELFHEDHENTNLYVVILTPCPPSNEFKVLLRDPFFSMCLIYLEGTPLLEKDLERARAASAQAIFILTNKFSGSPDEEDSKTILQQFSIKRYVQLANPPQHVLYCLQLIRPENRRHLVDGDGTAATDEDLVVCLNEIKMGVIAKSVMFPGTSTLIMNLLTSITIDGPDVEDIEDPDSDSDSDSDSDTDEASSVASAELTENWIDEYKAGCDWEVYTTELSDMFEGGSFGKLAQSMYNRLGVVLFALQVQDISNPSNMRILLNPASYVIPSKSEFTIHGLVIAQNKTLSDLSYSALKETLKKEGGDAEVFSALKTLADANTNLRSRRRYTGDTSAGGSPGGGSGHVDTPARLTPTKSATSNPFGSGSKLGASLPSLLEGGDIEAPDMEMGLKKRVKGQMALMKRFKEIKVSSDSEQEKLHKLEEEYMVNHYYMRSSPANIEDITISTSVLKEIPHIRQHIIITGKGLSNLYDLIRPLRARDLGPLRYIVILHPYELPHAVWRLLSQFDGILIVKGSPLEEEDIRRAGIFRAEQVVILADSSTTRISATAGTSAGLEALADADAIFTYKAMRRLNERARVVVEIVKQSNIGYLDLSIGNSRNDDGIVYEESDFRFTPQFASGELFTSSLLDTIICQAFYNPQIVAVVNKLISSRDQKELNAAANTAVNIGKSSTNIVGKSKLDGVASSALYQIPLPKEFHSKEATYGEMFKAMSAKGILALGLYRGVPPIVNRGEKMNTLPYVYTNPPSNTELFSCDKVFVLATKPVHIAHMSLQEISNQQQVVREVHHLEVAKQRGSHRNMTLYVNRWQGFLKRYEMVFNTLRLPKTRKEVLLGKIIEIKLRVDEMVSSTYSALPAHLGKDNSAQGGDSEAHVLSMLDMDSRKVKYVIEQYLPQVRKASALLQSVKGVAVGDVWKETAAKLFSLTKQAVGDSFKRVEVCSSIIQDLMKISHALLDTKLAVETLNAPKKAHEISQTEADKISPLSPSQMIAKANAKKMGWGAAVSGAKNTTSQSSAMDDAPLLDIPQLEEMPVDRAGGVEGAFSKRLPAMQGRPPVQSASASVVDSSRASDASSDDDDVSENGSSPVKVGGMLSGSTGDADDEGPLDVFKERCQALFTDMLDALEACIWDACASSAG